MDGNTQVTHRWREGWRRAGRRQAQSLRCSVPPLHWAARPATPNPHVLPLR